MQVGVLVTSNSTKILNNFGVDCSPKGREVSRYIAFSHSNVEDICQLGRLEVIGMHS